MNKVMLALLRFYKRYISPALPQSCKFTPTCSEYAMQAFSRYNFFKACALSAWRVLRCNPFSKGGYDPLK